MVQVSDEQMQRILQYLDAYQCEAPSDKDVQILILELKLAVSEAARKAGAFRQFD